MPNYERMNQEYVVSIQNEILYSYKVQIVPICQDMPKHAKTCGSFHTLWNIMQLHEKSLIHIMTWNK